MPWNAYELRVNAAWTKVSLRACNPAQGLVKGLVVVVAWWSLCFSLKAQPFIRSFEVLHDSVPIALEHAHQGSLLAPLNAHCLCLRIPGDVEGKMLVEMLDVSPNGFANFMGYASQGRLWACFKSDEVTFGVGGILFGGRRVDRMTLRRSADTSFR